VETARNRGDGGGFGRRGYEAEPGAVFTLEEALASGLLKPGGEWPRVISILGWAGTIPFGPGPVLGLKFFFQ
jgi:hypothetical protein